MGVHYCNHHSLYVVFLVVLYKSKKSSHLTFRYYRPVWYVLDQGLDHTILYT